ncbi:HNH endonuclease [Mycobacterium phage Neos5]|uniref:HNH endonuclease n=2 Tax=Pipefishvirus TaxID=1982899 RepID=A0A514TY39_9CAUD|nr:hypothetical protein PHAEDRUS_72 [Mycobacterium phage Phaedrus]YP_010103868.1 hypothetical protein KNU70_gp079 [Mycobacterium phage Obutu]AER50208.1 hypothetical protein KAMIYU_77 [Mycobacterium phage Kamiyu]AJD82666.1 HNH endonuclease [Mycobacterium phage Chandler]AKF15005.1 hypothetical protein SEA_ORANGEOSWALD_77 [Mycobacterium phage OrangeOswald]AUX82560.1 HNH endonuclease [Mycobacterium phage RagingRooster]AVR55987.1 hypothetical protein SEA_YAHALOM_75 [Mycobacterium phage Yahalom]AW
MATQAVNERWEPDEHLVSAVLAAGSGRRMSEFKAHDRAWLVSGLVLHGLTAEDIADRLHCSVRLVRSIIAEPITQLCRLYRIQARAFDGEIALARSEHANMARALVEMTEERDRIKEQFDRILDARMIGEEIRLCSKGHLMDRWNTYVHEKSGKRYCRTCRREYQADFRARVSET